MRPQATDYRPFYHVYVALSAEMTIETALSLNTAGFQTFLRSIPEEKADLAYAPGKWTVKQVLQHCIDTERIFAYRALCHARGEQQSLPGFDQDSYASQAFVSTRPLQQLVEESINVRRSSIALFESLTTDNLANVGYVNGSPITVISWGFIIAGHFRHHQNLLISKYKL